MEATEEPGPADRSGTHRTSPLPAGATRPEQRDRQEQLERNLERLSQELDELRTERDALKSRLHAALGELASSTRAESPPLASEPPGMYESGERIALIPVSYPPSLPASLPSFGPGAETWRPSASSAAPPADTACKPASSAKTLSRVVVSTRPPAEVSTEDGAGSSASSASSAERRRRERLGCELEVEFLDDTHLITGLTQDISEGGVFVATYELLALGTRVELSLELPGGRVQARGEVRWLRAECEAAEQRPGIGVAFTELTPEAVALLTEFCRSHPAHYYEM